MRFLALASLMLATVLGAANASAGFIPIDNFDGTPAGMQGSGAQVNAASSISSGFLNVAANDTGLGGVNKWQASVLYEDMNSILLGGFTKIRLQGLSNGSAARPVQASVQVVGPGGLTSSGFVNLGALSGDKTFSFPSITQFAGVTSLEVVFRSQQSFSFQVDSLQAVPEPTTMALIGLVGAGSGVAGWRRRRAAKA